MVNKENWHKNAPRGKKDFVSYFNIMMANNETKLDMMTNGKAVSL
jgi:hypothetical protein